MPSEWKLQTCEYPSSKRKKNLALSRRMKNTSETKNVSFYIDLYIKPKWHSTSPQIHGATVSGTQGTFKLFGRALINENSLQLWIHDCIDLRVSAKSVLRKSPPSYGCRKSMGAHRQSKANAIQSMLLRIKTQGLTSKALDFLAAWTMVLISAGDLTNL